MNRQSHAVAPQPDGRQSHSTVRHIDAPFIHRPIGGDHMRIAGVVQGMKDKLVAKLQAWFEDHPEAESLIYRRGCSLDALSLDGLRILDADTARWTPPPVDTSVGADA